MAADNPTLTLAALIGWALLVGGLIYTNYQNNRRESRKELRASLDNIIKDIDEVHRKALEYYTSEASETYQLGFEIKASEKRLVAKIERLGRIHKNFKRDIPVVEFMEVITGNDFESKSRKKRFYEEQSDTLLMRISFEANALIDVLEDCFCLEFKKHRSKPIKLNR